MIYFNLHIIIKIILQCYFHDIITIYMSYIYIFIYYSINTVSIKMSYTAPCPSLRIYYVKHISRVTTIYNIFIVTSTRALLNRVIVVPPLGLFGILIAGFNIKRVVWWSFLFFAATKHRHDGQANGLYWERRRPIVCQYG